MTSASSWLVQSSSCSSLMCGSSGGSSWSSPELQSCCSGGTSSSSTSAENKEIQTHVLEIVLLLLNVYNLYHFIPPFSSTGYWGQIQWHYGCRPGYSLDESPAHRRALTDGSGRCQLRIRSNLGFSISLKDTAACSSVPSRGTFRSLVLSSTHWATAALRKHHFQKSPWVFIFLDFKVFISLCDTHRLGFSWCHLVPCVVINNVSSLIQYTKIMSHFLTQIKTEKPLFGYSEKK